MKTVFVSLLFLVLCLPTYAQDSLDFLDKVNDKPKTVTKAKEEVIQTTTKKQTSVVTKEQPTKKKKSKKKSIVKQTTTPVDNTNSALIQNLNSEPKQNSSEAKVLNEEEVVNSGIWLDSPIHVDPAGLPGFAADLGGSIKSESGEVGNQNLSNPNGKSPSSDNAKPFFSFSDFFEKYKKAMLIFGIIILFAFYRLRSSRPSSSSRSYRR